MINDTDSWNRIAQLIAESVRRDLQGMPKRPIRIRGAPRVMRIDHKCPVVIVVPSSAAAPDSASIADWLKQHGAEGAPLDIYYVVENRHWASLAPRELCPSDERCGLDDVLWLRNFMPEYVLVPDGESRPPWCCQQATLVEWPGG